jgi:hypothetical protein
MIIVDAKNDCLESVGAVDRYLSIFLCINRYKFVIDDIAIVLNPFLLLTNQFSSLGIAQWCMSRD